MFRTMSISTSMKMEQERSIAQSMENQMQKIFANATKDSLSHLLWSIGTNYIFEEIIKIVFKKPKLEYFCSEDVHRERKTMLSTGLTVWTRTSELLLEQEPITDNRVLSIHETCASNKCLSTTRTTAADSTLTGNIFY